MLVHSGAGTSFYTDRVPLESFRPHWERLVRYGHSRFRVPGRKGKFARNPNGIGGGYDSKTGWKKKDRYGNTISIVGEFDVSAFCQWLRITRNEYESVERQFRRRGSALTIDFYLAEKILIGAGEPHTVRSLYVVRKMVGGTAAMNVRRKN